MLGIYNTNAILPKNKVDLVKSINSLGKVDISVHEPVEKNSIGFVKSEIDRFVGSGKKKVSVILIRER